MATQPSDTQSASSRERLLASAKRLFAAHGYEQTATSAIARDAGTSESQLMRYFGGKVGLLEAVFDEAWNELNSRIRKLVDAPASYRAALLDVLRTITTAFARDQDLAILMLFEGRRIRGDEPRVRMSRGFLAFAEVVRNLVRRAQMTRELDPALDASATTSAILGAAEAMIRDRLLARVGRGRAYSEKEIRRTVDAMLTGFEPASRRRSGRAPSPRLKRAR